MGEAVTLDLACQHCGGEMTLELDDWTDDKPAKPTVWACVYCAKENKSTFPARLAWVMKRQPPGQKIH